MYMITNEQANRLFEMVRNKIVKGEQRERLIAEIESLQPDRLQIGDLLRINGLDIDGLEDKTFKVVSWGENMTNGDKWRAMTDEQIAEIIQRDGCCACPCDEYLCEIAVAAATSEKEYNKICKAAIVKWLGTEAKDND